MVTAGKPFTREDLVSLKRADIQKLCKDYGVRANMKTEALIELLLDSIQSNMSPLVGPRPPQPQPALRRVSTRSSTRVSSLRSRGTSGSSSSTSLVASSGTTGSSGSPRTNKSKLTQYKLGVGRPSALAGSGPKFASRPSKIPRNKNSRNFRPPEATIIEEPETSQHASVPEHNVGPSTLRVDSTSTEDDVATRLGRLESTFREADIKRQLESLRHMPSQVACLIASMQQREAEITGLRGELNVCKTEILALRREVSRVASLEDQIRVMKDTLDQFKASLSSNGGSKARTTRRGPTPFTESNTNLTSNDTATPLYNAPVAPPATHSHEHPVTPATHQRGPSETALGKRPHAPSPDNNRGTSAIPENRETCHQEPERRVQPERKRTRTAVDRRPLQEKPAEHKSEPEKPVVDHEAGEDCVGSAGSTASGPSTQPSVSTPPPAAANGADHFTQFNAQQGDLMSDDLDLLDFCNAASSTPRDDIFNFFDKETFSQLSATKLAARIAERESGEQEKNDNPPPAVPQEPRRISTAAARPVTPPRPSGPGRFRVPAEEPRSTREDMMSPFDPYTAGLFTLPFEGGNSARRDLPNRNPANPMRLALGYGLTAFSGMLPDDSPVRPTARTTYGTELQNDTRFGDFGRDVIATSSDMAQYWNF